MIRSSFAILAFGLVVAPLPALAQARHAEPDAAASVRPRVVQGIGPDSHEAVSVQPAPAQTSPAQTARGALGGGFIELLMTGRDPTPASRGGIIYNDPSAGMAQRQARANPARSLDHHVPDEPAAEPLIPAHRLHTAALGGAQPDMRPIARTLPAIYQKQLVDYDGKHAPGTLVIDTPNKFLFLVQPGGKAMRYGIGVGRPGFEWAGVKSITMKREWPDWRPPAQMLKRRPDLPRYMPGGPDNPLGARALYLGSTLYRIHGTNEPHTIGQAVSSGCIRMTNDDVIDLYTRVKVGFRVIVM